jgi:hypothetical protein
VSTILKALQRVEGEKGGDGGEADGLREGLVPQGEPLRRESGSRWRIGMISLLAAILLGFFLWWMIPTGEVVQPSAGLPPAVAAAPERPSEPSRRLERRLPPKPETRPETKPATSLARTAAPAGSPPALAAPQTIASPPAPAPIEKPAPRVPVAEASPPSIAEPPAPRERVVVAPPPSPPIEEPTPRRRVAERPPPSATPPTPDARPETPPPPRTAEPPVPKAPAPAVVATVRPPKVLVKRTIWHPTPGRRVAEVEVEGRKGALELHEGDAVGTLVVAEIQPSGVVFLHGGEELHRKVGARR